MSYIVRLRVKRTMAKDYKSMVKEFMNEEAFDKWYSEQIRDERHYKILDFEEVKRIKSTTKEQAHLMQELQEDYLNDIDLSGGILLEFEKFNVMSKYKLPIDYTKLDWRKRKEVREQYVKEQNNNCAYCGCSLSDEAPKRITDKKINLGLFPPNFLKHPIHLQHNHSTGMTEGAVHNYCNAVMWQYENK